MIDVLVKKLFMKAFKLKALKCRRDAFRMILSDSKS